MTKNLDQKGPNALALVAALRALLDEQDKPGWHFGKDGECNSDTRAELISPEGIKFGVSTGDNYQTRGRIAISHHFSTTANTWEDVPSDRSEYTHDITVSLDATPNRIAKEILRRLLPSARKLHEVIRANVARRLAAQDKRAAALENLRNVWPDALETYDGHARTAYLHFSQQSKGAGYLYADLRPDYDGESVRFDHLGSVPFDLAVEIVRTIRSYCERAEQKGGAQ